MKKQEVKVMPVIVFLTAVFVVLKIVGAISWSWVWVFSPLWVIYLGAWVLMAIFELSTSNGEV